MKYSINGYIGACCHKGVCVQWTVSFSFLQCWTAFLTAESFKGAFTEIKNKFKHVDKSVKMLEGWKGSRIPQVVGVSRESECLGARALGFTSEHTAAVWKMTTACVLYLCEEMDGRVVWKTPCKPGKQANTIVWKTVGNIGLWMEIEASECVLWTLPPRTQLNQLLFERLVKFTLESNTIEWAWINTFEVDPF